MMTNIQASLPTFPRMQPALLLLLIISPFHWVSVPPETMGATIGVPLYTPKKPLGTLEYRRGVAALIKGELKKAEEAFQYTLDQEPNHVGALVGLAEIAVKKRDHQATERYLKHALRVAPENASIHQVWGRHLLIQNRLQEAEASYKRGLELNPKLIGLHVDLGNLYLLRLQKPSEAVGVYEAALNLDSSHAGAHYGLGSALVALGEIDRAETEFNEAGRLAPSNPLSFHALGRIHAHHRNFDQATQAFSSALKARSTFFPALIARGDIYTTQGHDDKALKEYEAAVTLAPKLGTLQVKMGLLHERNHRFDEAVEAFQTAITLDPKQVIAYNNLAWISAEQNIRLENALTWAKKAVELAPKVPAFQDTLGWVYWKRGNVEEAATVLEKASTMKPEQADIFYHLGVVQAERGRTDEAITALKKALTLSGDFPQADDARQRLQALETP